MIPSEVAAIADLIWADWRDIDEDARSDVLKAAYRIHEAGYRLPALFVQPIAVGPQTATTGGTVAL